MKPHSILLLDDDAWTADTALEMLRFQGFHAEWAPTISDALQKLSAHPFDLVLLDLDLGDERGESLIAEAEQNHVELPSILIVSGESSEEGAAVTDRIGAIGFLRKPYVVRDLLDQLARMPESRAN
ncbi:MAG TPA: response regulator [Rudaea sp.]|jgi:DNA-binding response OmpR family regulator|nr:response regulator [Rudaea sp.]